MLLLVHLETTSDLAQVLSAQTYVVNVVLQFCNYRETKPYYSLPRDCLISTNLARVALQLCD